MPADMTVPPVVEKVLKATGMAYQRMRAAVATKDWIAVKKYAREVIDSVKEIV